MGDATEKIGYSIIRHAVACWRQQGLPVDRILADRGIVLTPLPLEPAYIDLETAERVLEALWLAQPERPYPCLLDCQYVGRSVFGPITQMCLNAPSVGTAIKDLHEFEYVFGNPGKLVFDHRPGYFVMEIRPGFTRAVVRDNVADFLLGTILLALGEVASPDPLPLRYVTLRRPMPETAAGLTRFRKTYGDDIRFGADGDALFLAPDVLSMRSSVSDGHAYQMMRQLLRSGLMSQEVRAAFSERVRTAIRSMDGRSGITREAVAQKLGVGERNLNRRLAAEGLSYLDVAEGIRLERAQEYLAAGVLGLRDVAAELGYSESSSFSRWFKKAAGVSPSEFRENRSAPLAV